MKPVDLDLHYFTRHHKTANYTAELAAVVS